MPKVKTRKNRVEVRNVTPFELETFRLIEAIEEFRDAERNESTEMEISDDVNDLLRICDDIRWQFQLMQINGPTIRVEQ